MKTSKRILRALEPLFLWRNLGMCYINHLKKLFRILKLLIFLILIIHYHAILISVLKTVSENNNFV